MKMTLSVEGEKELRQQIRKLSAKYKKKVAQETYASGIDIQRTAKENLRAMKKWDTGNAANSIIVQRENQGMTAKVEATAPYSIYIEFGSRPHFPPPDALEGWAKRHGFDSAWPICIAISKRGIPEAPFLGPAYEKEKEKYYQRLIRILDR